MTVSETVGNGFGWQNQQIPYLAQGPDSSIFVLGRPNDSLMFVEGAQGYEGQFSIRDTLELNENEGVYRLTEYNGTVTEFDSFTMFFTKQIAPGGATIEVTSTDSKVLPREVERTTTVNGVTTVEQFQYTYSNPNGNTAMSSIVVRRKVDQGSWSNVSKVSYTYYGYDSLNGGYDDLETATTATWDGSQWQDTGTTYYRYYVETESSSSSGGAGSSSSGGANSEEAVTPLRQIKYVITPSSYVRLEDDPNVTDPLTVSNSIAAQYADDYFAYDSDGRVTRHSVKGGSETFDFTYTESAFADGYNSWKTRTTETRPDGSKIIVYSNYAGQTMFSILQDGTDEWYAFSKYNNEARVILQADPSAISGYDEQYADLLHEVSGSYQYLKDSDGLIRTWSYHAQSGYLASGSLQEGEQGTSIKLFEYEYTACYVGAAGGSSSSSSSGSSGSPATAFWFMSKKIQYPSVTDQTKKIETSFTHAFYEDTCQVKQTTTTLPVVSTTQNGSGVADTTKAYFDQDGYPTWRMDERGFISLMEYDIPTGAVTRQVQDVDTSEETGAPTGWTTPSGGGLNLVTDFEHDDKGRMTQSLGPSHAIDIAGSATTIRRATWIVYSTSSTGKETRVGNGYATGTSPSYTYTLINPVSITKTDLAGRVQEQIQGTRASSSGKLLPTDTFAQTTYTRWSTTQYTDCCYVTSQRVYHSIPATGTGSEGTNYDETVFGYDSMKRRNRSVTPGGTITFPVFDARGLVEKSYTGTDDTGATSSDPTGGGATGNNMVLTTTLEYDSGNDGGDGNLTKQTQHVDGSTTRVTTFTYDFRDRRTDTDGEVDFYEQRTWDNINRVTKSERFDTTSTGNLIAKSETKYDDRGRVYQSVRYGVNPSTGAVGNSLTDNTWYDASGNVMKQLPAGAEQFSKTAYDSLGRSTTRYAGYDLDETTYADAGTVTGDTIMEQSETIYDDASNVIQSTTRQRYHNAPASQTGELKNPSETPKARVTYVASYPDALGRGVATANYGTNGGSALVRSSTIPTGTDDILVSQTEYDSAGNMESSTDPSGMATSFEHDDVGRETSRTMNPQSGSSSSSAGGCDPSVDTNVTVETSYNADGNVHKITAKNAATGDQVTEYVYGTTLTDSEIASSLLKRAEVYPDSVDGSDRIAFEYNRQSQVTKQTDQGGTIHEYDFDKLGRQTHDRVTALDTGVDGAVRRISTSYEVRGMRETITSWNNASVTSGDVVNEVEFTYNDFGQLTADYQNHSAAVNVLTTPKVQYGYASGSDNTIRATTITYPDGRVITYDYDSTDSMADALSRVASIVDDDGPSTHLADYSYLGQNTFVETDYTEPDIKYTLIGTAGGNDPDTGDIYRGLDRFGRIVDSYWYDYGSSADVDRIKYGYGRSGNRLWRENVVARSLSKEFDELYEYDEIHRLKDMSRGTLNSGRTALTSTTFAQCWGLDETGNWSNFREDDDGNGSWNLNQDRTANKVNEISDITESTGPSWVTPAYSKAGDMTTVPKPADPTASFTATYDAWNRLTKLVDTTSSDTVAEYEYDGAKRRTVQKFYDAGTLDETRHLYYTEPSKWQVIEERVDSDTDSNRQFVWGLRYNDDLILRDRDTTGNGTLNERLYALQDANWNVTAVADTGGTIQQRITYHAYGRAEFHTSAFVSTTNSTDWQTLYAGYQLDLRSSLYHVRHRQLVSATGSWSTRDPLGPQAGINLYQYLSGSPASSSDPLGLIRFSCSPDKECENPPLKKCRVTDFAYLRAGVPPSAANTLQESIGTESDVERVASCVLLAVTPHAAQTCIAGILGTTASPLGDYIDALTGGNNISGGNIWIQFTESSCEYVECGCFTRSVTLANQVKKPTWKKCELKLGPAKQDLFSPAAFKNAGILAKCIRSVVSPGCPNTPFAGLPPGS